MIKINLASRKQSGLSPDAKSGGMSASLNSISLDKFKELPIRKLISPILIGIIATYGVESFQAEEYSAVEATFNQLKIETDKLQVEVNRLKEYEGNKIQIEADEKEIRTKLNTVQKLVSNRSDTVKILNILTQVTPKDVWLSSVKLELGAISIRGNSLGFGLISDFMKSLEDSPELEKIELISSLQSKDRWGREVVSFDLKGKQR